MHSRWLTILLFLALPVAAAERSDRVVLLSIDGVSDVILDKLLASGKLRGGAFERMKARGVVAASMTPEAISSTPVSHATLFSGTWPAEHGIASVAMPGAEIGGELRRGFSVPTDVDRLWTVAQKAGKRVLCIMAPGAEMRSPATTCSETVTFDVMSKAQTLDGAPHGDDLMSRIQAKLGPSPGVPDGSLPTKGEMTDEEYVSHYELFVDYIGKAVAMQLGRDDWDLLIVYTPMLDEIEHRFLLTDPRQAEYREEGGARRKRYARFIERAYKQIDGIVSSWMSAAPRTNFVVVSDHGTVPTHHVVLVSNALAAAGLRVSGNDAQVRAISSGASVQIYVNSKQRFAKGVVSDDELPQVIAKVVKVLRDLRDPETSQPIFTTVATWKELAPLKVQHASAGDVYASARPGWGATGRFDAAVPVFVTSTLSPDVRKRVSRSPAEEEFLLKGSNNEMSLGVHGHRPGDPRTQAIFYAFGSGVPRKKVGVVSMIDVAPTVLQLLGVPRPGTMKGKARL